MSKRAKLLARIRNNPKTVTFADLQTLLEAFGFALVSVKGSHHTYRIKLAGVVWKLVIPFKKPHLNAAYVRNALKLIGRIEKEDGDHDDA